MSNKGVVVNGEIAVKIQTFPHRCGICQMFYTSKIPKLSYFKRVNYNLFDNFFRIADVLLIHFEQIVTFCIQIQTNSNHFVKTYNNSCPNLLN